MGSKKLSIIRPCAGKLVEFKLKSDLFVLTMYTVHIHVHVTGKPGLSLNFNVR